MFMFVTTIIGLPVVLFVIILIFIVILSSILQQFTKLSPIKPYTFAARADIN